MVSDGFAARAARLFGALEEPATGIWQLNTQQGFAAGAEKEDSSEEEEEHEGAEPQSRPYLQAAGSDDEDENEYKVKGLFAGLRAL